MQATAPDTCDHRQMRRARALRRAGIALLVLFVEAGAVGVLGVRTASVRVDGANGASVTVVYPRVTRPGLPVNWQVQIALPAGAIGSDVTVRTSARYLAMFDENGYSPDPDRSSQDEEWISWTFEAVDSTQLVVSGDVRVEPGVQWGRSGRTQVIVDDEPVADVAYRTIVLP